MIGAILNGILQFFINVMTLLLAPIDAFIYNALPSFTPALMSINAVIDYVINVIGFAINASGISDVALELIVVYYTFTIGGTLAFAVVKLIIKWYNALKP